MTLIPSSPKEIIELISKGITLALQLGILTGSICVVSYCLRINYFPQELSIGDGLLFLIVAACFGTIYTFLFGSLVALVIVSSSIDKWITKSRNHFRKRLLGLKTSWALLALLLLEDAVSSVLSVALLIAPTVFLVSFFGSLGSSNYWYWYFLYLFILLLIIYRIYIKTEENIEKIKEDGLSKIEPPEKQDIVRLDELRKKRVICLVVIFFLPLLIGLMSGASGKLLDEVMRMTHFRVESPVLHIKEPYSAFVPESLLAKKQLGVKGFTSFEGASVLLKGFGKTMVIEFSDGDTKRKLEVPNDQIIVEER